MLILSMYCNKYPLLSQVCDMNRRKSAFALINLQHYKRKSAHRVWRIWIFTSTSLHPLTWHNWRLQEEAARRCTRRAMSGNQIITAFSHKRVSLTRLWGSVNPSGCLRAIQMSAVKKGWRLESNGSISVMMDGGARWKVTCLRGNGVYDM